MVTKFAEFILSHFQEWGELAEAKIKELADTQLLNEEKKAQLDAFIIEKVNEWIDAYDLPVLPDAVVDPLLKKVVEKYVPEINQYLFDLGRAKLGV